MEFTELIGKRRSVRGKYLKTDFNIEEIKTILQAAQQAPSWKNLQGARCYAVCSEEMLERTRKALPEFNQKNSANALLLVSTFVKDLSGFIEGKAANEAGNLWGAYDLGLRDAYLVLAAKNAGYDTLIMGIRDGDALRQILDIPENEEIMSVIALGKSEEEGKNGKRKDLDEVMKIL